MFNSNELAGIVKAQLSFDFKIIKHPLDDSYEEHVILFSDGSVTYCDGVKDWNKTINQLWQADLERVEIGPENKNQGTQKSPLDNGF